MRTQLTSSDRSAGKRSDDTRNFFSERSLGRVMGKALSGFFTVRLGKV